MTIEIPCVRCHGRIRVQSVGEESSEVPQVPVEFQCPFCDAMNAVLLPGGAKYVIGIEN